MPHPPHIDPTMILQISTHPHIKWTLQAIQSQTRMHRDSLAVTNTWIATAQSEVGPLMLPTPWRKPRSWVVLVYLSP